ncbi:MAG: hypothetical protein ACLSH6_02800 [Limosilactobacillus pontis]
MSATYMMKLWLPKVGIPQADRDDQKERQDAVVVVRQQRELPVPVFEAKDEVLERKQIHEDQPSTISQG